LRKTPEREVIREVERKISEAGRQSLEGMTLAELVHRMMKKRHQASGNRNQVKSET
jgi:hypothetical protein